MYRPIEINRIEQNSAAVADFGPGAGWRLVIQSWVPEGDGQPQHGSARVESFPLPKAPAVAPAWPQWRLNPAHTGAAGSGQGQRRLLARRPRPARSSPTATRTYYGSPGGWHLKQPIVGMASTPSRKGYWLVTRSGRVIAFGDAKLHGSASSLHLSQPVVGIARTPSGKGYWLVTRSGRVLAYGDATLQGSALSRHLTTIVGIAPTRSGQGYWLVTRGGSVFPFGDAKWHGGTGSKRMKQPIVGIVPSASGNGYWLVQKNGHVFTFGDAHSYGSRPTANHVAIVALTPTAGGRGYWLVGQGGQIYSFGNAQLYTTSQHPHAHQQFAAAAAS